MIAFNTINSILFLPNVHLKYLTLHVYKKHACMVGDKVFQISFGIPTIACQLLFICAHNLTKTTFFINVFFSRKSLGNRFHVSFHYNITQRC